MKKLTIVFVLLFLLISISIVWAQEEKINIVHYHWTQPPYDEINARAAKTFMEKYPNVNIEIIFIADPDTVSYTHLDVYKRQIKGYLFLVGGFVGKSKDSGIISFFKYWL